MSDTTLTEDELELLQQHRAKKARQSGRKVTVRAKHEDSGAEYSFDLDGDEADKVISRHSALWAAEEEEEEGDEAETPKPKRKGPYFGAPRSQGGAAKT